METLAAMTIRIVVRVLFLVVGSLVVSCSQPEAHFQFELRKFEKQPAALKETFAKLSSLVEESEGEEGLRELAYLLHANDYLQEAKSVYERIQKVENEVARWPYLIAHIEQLYGQSEKAILLLEEVKRIEPRFSTVHLRLGNLYLKRGDIDLAEQAYRDCIVLGGQEGFCLSGLARIAIAKKDWAKAKTLLVESIYADERIASNYRLLSQVLVALGETQEAEWLRRESEGFDFSSEPADSVLDVLDQYCFDVGRLMNRSDQLVVQEKYEEARRLLGKALEIEPANPHVLLSLCKVAEQMGEAQEGDVFLDAALEADAGFEAAIVERLDRMRQRGREEEAFALCEYYREDLHDSVALAFVWADLLKEKGAINEAVEVLEDIADKPRYRRKGYELAGNYLWGVGDKERSVVAYEKAREASLLAVKPRAMLASHYLNRGDLLKAYEVAKEAFQVDPYLGGLSELLGQVCLGLGTKSVAEERNRVGVGYLVEAVSVYPESRDALGKLLAHYSDVGDVEGALVLSRNLRQEFSESLAVIEFSAAVSVLAGDSERAVGELSFGFELARRRNDAAWGRRFAALLQGLGIR